MSDPETRPVELTKLQLGLIIHALGHRAGRHPCDHRPKLAMSTMSAVVDAHADFATEPTCGARDASEVRCQP